MELGVRQFRWHEQFHGIPWNSMELEVRQFRWHEKFHGIPWNFVCANFADTSSSMEFHGIPWNLECANFADTSSGNKFFALAFVVNNQPCFWMPPGIIRCYSDALLDYARYFRSALHGYSRKHRDHIFEYHFDIIKHSAIDIALQHLRIQPPGFHPNSALRFIFFYFRGHLTNIGELQLQQG